MHKICSNSPVEKISPEQKAQLIDWLSLTMQLESHSVLGFIPPLPSVRELNLSEPAAFSPLRPCFPAGFPLATRGRSPSVRICAQSCGLPGKNFSPNNNYVLNLLNAGIHTPPPRQNAEARLALTLTQPNNDCPNNPGQQRGNKKHQAPPRAAIDSLDSDTLPDTFFVSPFVFPQTQNT